MKFGTIVVDPPWSYERTSHHHKLTGYATEEYPLLSTAELAKLPIGDLADDDCVLLLWATWPFVPDALSLCEAWGFSYVTGLPWVKTKGEAVIYGVGYWLRGATEPILVAKRGKAFRTNFVGLIAPGLKHSRKPDDIYELGNSLPGPHLEIFARSYDDEPASLAGWYQLGYEVATDGSDIRDRLHQMLQMPDYRWEPFRVNGKPPQARPKAPQAIAMNGHMDEFHAVSRDGARHNHPSPLRYRAVTAAVKNCLACNHWARFHPGHGPCKAYTYDASRPCTCTEFSDPQPGRPDQVYTREQIDRMTTWRWNAQKDRIFLLKDGRYGLWDQWASEDWKAKPPPKAEVPPEAPLPVPEAPPEPEPVWVPPEGWPEPWNLLEGSLALPDPSG
jgi:N6-adenosine-specific RNA methylase IME4